MTTAAAKDRRSERHADLDRPPRPPFGWLREKRNRRSNLRLIRRAVREGWDVPDELRPVLVREMTDLIHAPDISAREMAGILNVMVEMDRANDRDRLARDEASNRRAR